MRGDMIELYKILSGKYDSEITEWITGKCIERQYDTRSSSSSSTLFAKLQIIMNSRNIQH